MGLDFLIEISLALDFTCEDQTPSCAARHLNCKVLPLCRMDPTDLKQISLAARTYSQRVEINSIVNDGGYLQSGYGRGLSCTNGHDTNPACELLQEANTGVLQSPRHLVATSSPLPLKP